MPVWHLAARADLLTDYKHSVLWKISMLPGIKKEQLQQFKVITINCLKRPLVRAFKSALQQILDS